jgi:hypothetical protein
MGLQRVPLKDFRGGLNTRDSPFDLQQNESPDLLNVTLTDLVGQLRVRQGKVALANPPTAIDHCRQAVINNTNYLMASIGGKIYAYNGGPNTWSAALFTGTASTIWDFCQMKNASNVEKVYCSNGTDVCQTWDGIAGATTAVAAMPKGKRILPWRNKLVMLGVSGQPADTALFSQPGDPEAVAAYDTAQLRGDDDETSDNLEMNVLADRLYIFKRRSVWVFVDPGALTARRIGEPGAVGPFTSDVCQGKLYWYNEQGIWATGGVAVNYESGQINSWFPTNAGAGGQPRLIATRDAYPRILLTVPTKISSIYQMIELIPSINFRRIGGRRYVLLPAFMVHDFSASALGVYRVDQNSPWMVVGGQPLVNKLFQYFSGADDAGQPINAHWTSSWLGIQAEEPYERIRRLNIELTGDVTVNVYKEFNTVPDFTATLNSDSVWDGGVWSDGVGLWDAGSVQYRFTRVRPESRGRFHQIQFQTVSPGAPFQINAAELAVRGGKEH